MKKEMYGCVSCKITVQRASQTPTLVEFWKDQFAIGYRPHRNISPSSRICLINGRTAKVAKLEYRPPLYPVGPFSSAPLVPFVLFVSHLAAPMFVSHICRFLEHGGQGRDPFAEEGLVIIAFSLVALFMIRTSVGRL